ncbi:MAG TPA: S41 family peptidase [Bryobacteraceae bacterium]|nr:S41 family peptidase [Bryobacteraceae bacterium]HOQ46323.1 S41 family peptidase [Bryobacteraceae bacterium]HPQ15641.1 S41 family peptidase [Bryobacteraceae bacterium]HPU72240.1 S41 family peptidase [Bryobacteraceae bacterium]
MSSRLRNRVVVVSTVLVAVLLMGALLGKSAAEDGAYRQLAVYTEVLSHIKSDYVEEPDLKSVTLGAVNGLLESIDPFASYLNAEQYKEYQKNKGAHQGGVGLVLSKRFGYVGVVAAIPGSPAAKAGLTTGDMVESINGVATRDMPLAYAELLLQGKPGTTVELSVLSVRHPEPKKITLTRAVIEYPKVESKMLPGEIGYLKVQAMVPGTAADLAAAIKKLEQEGAKRLILDLRNSGAGTPEEGIQAANLFQESGLISYLQGQRVPRRDFEADPAKAVTKLPMVVLTNRGTANGAEIVAAALLESKRAEVVGERTYGDAALRRPIPMDDGGAIILSVAKYYSPGGKAIQDTGVTPTHQVSESEPLGEPGEEEVPEEALPPSSPEDDPILKKGIEVLTKNAQAKDDSQRAALAAPQPGP